MNYNSEGLAVETPVIELLKSFGWTPMNGLREMDGAKSEISGRTALDEVVLIKYLRPALEKLNPNAQPIAINNCIDELTRDRSMMSPIEANKEVYKLIKDGFSTQQDDNSGIQENIKIKIIDWDNPENNNYIVFQQFWILGRLYKRRPDIIGFINGIPLIQIEVKSPQKKAENAYTENIRDYRDVIPQLFWYNQFIIISNGRDARLGSTFSPLDFYKEWKRINDEGEVGLVSLDTILKATCPQNRIIDIIENFIIFSYDENGKVIKLVAQNHQYLGVNNAIRKLQAGQDARLGVFWHTQGSGKSYSMVFFAQKVFRKIAGDWTFIVITDRQDLDKQIYKNFADAGTIFETESQVRADSCKDLQAKLRQNHRYVFTLIHKFQTPIGEEQETISARGNIIVMTDEAHRSQYATLAMNMRKALPMARFIGFTGTPLINSEAEKTCEVFGDYVSTYNFKQAVDDQATVPLFYENRIPELQLSNDDFEEDLEKILATADLNDEQEKKLERRFSRQYQIITREDRIDRIAADIVSHFLGRGFQGKALVVSINKITAVRMYNQVKKHWQLTIDWLKGQLASELSGDDRKRWQSQLEYMQETDMAVVISSSQNEVDDFRLKGLDIIPHRERMLHEDLENNYKNPHHPLRIIFVCAMWITGFDVKSLSTVYLDRPMHGHTLMQTIARANRIFAGKNNGLIVDYIGVFRDLQAALCIYGDGKGGDVPVKNKNQLIIELREVVFQLEKFISKSGIKIDEIEQTKGFERVASLEKVVDYIVASEDNKKEFSNHSQQLIRLFKGILPDPTVSEFLSKYQLIHTINGCIASLHQEVSIENVEVSIEKLLDESVIAGSYTIDELKPREIVDLSKIDFERISQEFGQKSEHIQVERLKCSLESRLSQLIELNKTRLSLSEIFQQLISDYNAGPKNLGNLFAGLKELSDEINEEAERAKKEQMTEEELAIFDYIINDAPLLDDFETKQVKTTVSELLFMLKNNSLGLDWKKSPQNRAILQRDIRNTLNQDLPEKYPANKKNELIKKLYEHFYEKYEDVNVNVYA